MSENNFYIATSVAIKERSDSAHVAVWAHEIFAASTYDTDYILIKENNLADAISVLGESGYTVEENKGVLTE